MCALPLWTKLLLPAFQGMHEGNVFAGVCLLPGGPLPIMHCNIAMP